MYSYRIKCHEFLPPSINVVVFNPPPGCDHVTQEINNHCSTIVNTQKSKIDKYSTSKAWDNAKLIINPYELICISERDCAKYGCDLITSYIDLKRRHAVRSIAHYEPLSRSFFKMIEIIHEFMPTIICPPLRTTSAAPIKTVHLAEGPGGFIEAVRYVRPTCDGDLLYGITLKDTRREIPGWSKSKKFLRDNQQVKIITGADDTGNLYNPENIEYLISRAGAHSAILVTGDGGFDFSIDYNKQEQACAKLIFAQVLAALKCQALGGTFVCKIFDMSKLITAEILYLLQCFYGEIIIYKPYTSRVANSEKYIICRDYKVCIDELYWQQLKTVLVIWNTHELNRIFTAIPAEFIDHINSISLSTANNQSQYINETINIIERGTEEFRIDNTQNIEWLNANIKKQTNNAREWCRKYNIPY